MVSLSGEQFFAHLRDAFDVLYREGQEGAPKMLSVGLHCRLVGRPARLASLERFLDHVQSHDDVWITRRIDIADHWRSVHPAGSAVGQFASVVQMVRVTIRVLILGSTGSTRRSGAGGDRGQS